MGTAIVIGRFGIDAAQGILLSDKYVNEYQLILAEPDPKRRTDKLLHFLGSMAVSGGLLFLSMCGNHADLAQLGTPKPNLGKLGQRGEIVDLAQSEHSATSHEPRQVEPQTAAIGADKSWVVDPVPGLYDAIDATENVAPPGWRFIDQKVADSTIPGAWTITTFVTGPKGEKGWLRRAYDPNTKILTMSHIFVDKLPSKIDIGVPFGSSKGVPLSTYLTLRQMKMAEGQFGELQKVKMSQIQNVESLMLFKHLTDQRMSPHEAVRQTHSVEYASTSIQQSGHTVTRVYVDRQHAYLAPIGRFMRNFETNGGREAADPKKVEKHERLLLNYGMDRSSEVLVDYDIYLVLAPHPENP